MHFAAAARARPRDGRTQRRLGDTRAVETLGRASLGALAALVDAVEHCRFDMMAAITEAAVDEAATSEILRETIQTIDELASHHSIEEIYIDDIEAVKIDAHFVWHRATGPIGAELQWGSNSDLRRGDGATLNHSFPFICDIPASVNDLKILETSIIDLRVHDGGWRDRIMEDDFGPQRRPPGTPSDDE
jgi:hypothetical protein